MGKRDHGRQVCHLARGSVGIDATEEAHLVSVDIAETREVALIDEGNTDGLITGRPEIADGRVCIPVRPEKVGPEVTDRGGFRTPVEYLGDAEEKPTATRSSVASTIRA